MGGARGVDGFGSGHARQCRPHWPAAGCCGHGVKHKSHAVAELSAAPQHREDTYVAHQARHEDDRFSNTCEVDRKMQFGKA